MINWRIRKQIINFSKYASFGNYQLEDQYSQLDECHYSKLFFSKWYLVYSFTFISWSIVDLQCVPLHCTAKWLSYKHFESKDEESTAFISRGVTSDQESTFNFVKFSTPERHEGNGHCMAGAWNTALRLSRKLHEKDRNTDKFKRPWKRCCLLDLPQKPQEFFLLYGCNHSNTISISLLLHPTVDVGTRDHQLEKSGC